jgi:GNAT superfamily N-acetyltransferase
MMFNISLADATPADLPDVAHIHVRCWQESYVGQVPQAYLDGLDATARQRKWEELFDAVVKDGLPGLTVARCDGKLVGFISYSLARDNDRSGQGEIYAVYLLKEYWNKGLGFRLFDTAGARFRAAGVIKAYLWVLDTNENAIRAYARWGGRIEPGYVKNHEIGGRAVKETLVSFDL